MTALIRCVIIGSIVVAILAAAFFALLFNPEQPEFGGVVFSWGEAADVQAVQVWNEFGSFVFYFDFDENGFVVDDIPPYLVDLEAFVAFMTNSARITALQVIPNLEIVEHLPGYWTDLAGVEVIFFDGPNIIIRILAREPVSGNYYAQVFVMDDRITDNLYIIPRSLASQFLQPKTQVITRMITPPLLVSSPLAAVRDITFTGGGLTRPVTVYAVGADADPDVALQAISFGAPTHIVRGAANYQLDQTYGVEIFGSLFAIMGDIVAYGLTSEQIAAFGFDDPYMIIQYDMVNGINADMRRMTIKIAQAEDGLYYLTLNDICAIFIVPRLPFMDIEFSRLPLRRFLNPLIMSLSAVTIQTPDREYRLEIDNTDMRNPIITFDTMTLDVDLFRSFFRLITSASHDGTYLGPLPPPHGQAVLQIVYEYIIPEKKPDILALYPGVERRLNVHINGAGEFAMRDLFAERVIQGVENLISGNIIEENW